MTTPNILINKAGLVISSINNLSKLFAITLCLVKWNYAAAQLKSSQLKTVMDSIYYIQLLAAKGTHYQQALKYSKSDSLLTIAVNFQKSLYNRDKAKATQYPLYLCWRGRLYGSAGFYEKAEKDLLESLSISNERLNKIQKDDNDEVEGEEKRIFEVLMSLSLLYYEEGDFEKFEFYAHKAQSIADQYAWKDETDTQIQLWLNQAAFEGQYLGQYRKAILLLEKALELQQKPTTYQPDKSLTALLLQNIGAFEILDGQFSSASKRLAESRKTWQKIAQTGRREYANLLTNIAQILIHSNRKAEAVALLDSTLFIINKLSPTPHPTLAITYLSIANVQAQLRNYTAAEKLYSKARTLAEKLGKRHSYYQTTLFQTAHFYESIRRYDKALECRQEVYKSLVANVEQSFEFLSENQKEAFLRRNANELHRLFSVVDLQKGRHQAYATLAYHSALQFNGLLLNESRRVASAIQQRHDTTLIRQFDALQFTRRALSRQYDLPDANIAQIGILEAEAEKLDKEIVKRFAELQKPELSQSTDWQEISQKLEPNQAAIAFVRFPKFLPDLSAKATTYLYGAFIIRRDSKSPQFIQLCSEEQLDESLESRASIDISKGIYLSSTYRLIWSPLQKFLTGINRIYYSTDGLLHQLAFDALKIPAQGNSQSKWLSEKYDLYQVYNTAEIAQGIKPMYWQKDMSAVLIGGVDYDPVVARLRPVDSTRSLPIRERVKKLPPFQQLTTSLLEIVGIQEILNLSKKSLFTDTTANEQNLKSLSGKAPTILHIASHGFFIPQGTDADKASGAGSANQPLLRSGLALDGANWIWMKNYQPRDKQEDGILTAYEVATMDFSQTQLAVLSACESALGDVRDFEGVYGLQRSFRAAGVEKLLMSLHIVEDAPTYQLLTEFYECFAREKDAHSAFRMAQEKIRKTHDPSVWAAFVLVE